MEFSSNRLKIKAASARDITKINFTRFSTVEQEQLEDFREISNFSNYFNLFSTIFPTSSSRRIQLTIKHTGKQVGKLNVKT